MPEKIDLSGLVRQPVLELEPYHLQKYNCDVKLNQNESPYDLPQDFKQAVVKEFVGENWNRYPEFTGSALLESLADFLNLPQNQLLAANGSNDLLQLIISLVMPGGTRILTVSPTFAIYRQLCRIAGVDLLELSFTDDWQFPVDEIIDRLRKGDVRLCILCSPNSPTGSVLRPDDLERILQNTDSFVVLDEAYHEFSTFDYTGVFARHENLILLRTFSKALGLAALRVGYLIARPALVEQFAKAKLPYSMNRFSEFVATKVLRNPHLVRENIRKIKLHKKSLFRELRMVAGARVFPSQGNFFMIETAMPGSTVFERLLRCGILVRDISRQHPRLVNKVRITVGTPEENAGLVRAFKSIC